MGETCVGLFALGLSALAAPSAAGSGGSAAASEPHVVPHTFTKLAQLTGDVDVPRGIPTKSRTGERFGFIATDLGSSFEHAGRLVFLFGDSAGGPNHADALAWTDAKKPEDLELTMHIGDDGKFLPLLVPGVRLGAFEVPSYGISIDGHMHVVLTTDHSDRAVMGRSLVAVSEDEGRTFRAVGDLSRKHFINVALARGSRTLRGLPFDDAVLLWGSGRYRASDVRLACAPADRFGAPAALRFFAGMDGATPRWVEDEERAWPLFDHPVVGELSVAWIGSLERWVMLYNSPAPRGIVMRTATQPWGPWSDPEIAFDPWADRAYGTFMHVGWDAARRDSFHDRDKENVFGGEYGPYLIPRFTTGDARRTTLVFTMSTWNPYQVVLASVDVGMASAGKRREQRLLPGGREWKSFGADPVRFDRFGTPALRTYGAGGDRDVFVSRYDFTCGRDARLDFRIHGGHQRIVLVREPKALPESVGDVVKFGEDVLAGRFGEIVESVAGPSNNDVDVSVGWSLGRHVGEALSLYAIDTSSKPWGFLAVSELVLSESGSN